MSTKCRETRLTYSVTVTMPKGMTIRLMREYILSQIRASADKVNGDFSDMKVHLTNKEVIYGKR